MERAISKRMLPKDIFEEVPGRVRVRDLAKTSSSLTRESYLASHPHPLLIQLNEGSAKAEEHQKTGGFATVVLDKHTSPLSLREGLYAYEVTKRPGANAFSFLVTLGRTKNNDILIEEASVSKFHASFKKDPAGRWTISDMSTNGVQLDGARIPREQAVPLRSGHLILLADLVEMLFLMPPEAHEHLKRIGK